MGRLRNIEYLKVNEAKLEQELEHSEHLRLHHEGESQSKRRGPTREKRAEAATRILKANMALNDVFTYDMAQDLVERKMLKLRI